MPVPDELVERVNAGDRKADRELMRLNGQRAKLQEGLLTSLIEKADTSITPPNMNIVNKASLPKEYHRMAESMTNHE